MKERASFKDAVLRKVPAPIKKHVVIAAGDLPLPMQGHIVVATVAGLRLVGGAVGPSGCTINTSKPLQEVNVLLLKLGVFGLILETGSLAISNPRRAIMAIQIVMDRTGDTRHLFNPNDAQELARAEQRFYELTKVGFTAALRIGP